MRFLVRCCATSALALAIGFGLAGCDTGVDIDEPSPAPDVTTVPEEPAEVVTEITLHSVGKKFGADRRERLKASMAEVIDPWIENAFLGEFPRADWSPAFSGFADKAAQDAQGRDLDVLTNAALAGQIDAATATRRRVKVSVFAYQGRPRGATAHVVLDFDTTGVLEQSMRLRGDLFLTREQGAWKVFGYDVRQAVVR